jgi:hypothetical protein
MTLICSTKDVDKLISEMHCWDGDPDLRRIADAIPLEVLEAAYVAKLDALPKEPLPEHAKTARDKLNVMRRIFAAWCRAPKWQIGYLLVSLYDKIPWDNRGAAIGATPNAALVVRLEQEYPPSK